MKDLPKKFPEYSIMYKTILKKIQELENEKDSIIKKERGVKREEIQSKIQRYQKELNKIKKMFPEDFFEKN